MIAASSKYKIFQCPLSIGMTKNVFGDQQSLILLHLLYAMLQMVAM